MPVVSHITIGGGTASVEFVTNAQNVVTNIVIRNTTPMTVRVIINSASSGYSFDSELVLTAPLTISVPKPRQFPNDDSTTVVMNTTTRSVP